MVRGWHSPWDGAQMWQFHLDLECRRIRGTAAGRLRAALHAALKPAWSPDDTKLVVQRWDQPRGTTSVERCYLEAVDIATLERTVILEGPEGDGAMGVLPHPALVA